MTRAKLRDRLYYAATLILIAGFCCAALAYSHAGVPDTDNPLGNPLDESKSYRHSLEMYGGKANLLATQFTEWFSGLWHGKSLGITLACLTLLVSGALALFAHNLPTDSE